MNVQDDFFKRIVSKKQKVNIYLANGIKLTGVVTSFDQYTFTLSGGSEDQLIYKSAVATVMPVAVRTGNEA